MASRIGVMRDGALEQVGTPADIYERPANRFVAEFLGAANILPVTVKQVGIRGTFLRLADGSTVRAMMKGALGQPALLALRPERLRPDGTGENTLEGTIAAIEYRGEAMQLTVRLPDGSLIRALHTLADGSATAPAPGAPARLTFTAEAAIVLPDA